VYRCYLYSAIVESLPLLYAIIALCYYDRSRRLTLPLWKTLQAMFRSLQPLTATMLHTMRFQFRMTRLHTFHTNFCQCLVLVFQRLCKSAFNVVSLWPEDCFVVDDVVYCDCGWLSDNEGQAAQFNGAVYSSGSLPVLRTWCSWTAGCTSLCSFMQQYCVST